MVAPVHARKGCRRHLARYALISFASCLVMSVGGCILNLFGVAGQAGVVCLVVGLEAVPAAAGVAGDAVELA